MVSDCGLLGPAARLGIRHFDSAPLIFHLRHIAHTGEYAGACAGLENPRSLLFILEDQRRHAVCADQVGRGPEFSTFPRGSAIVVNKEQRHGHEHAMPLLAIVSSITPVSEMFLQRNISDSRRLLFRQHPLRKSKQPRVDFQARAFCGRQIEAN